MDTHRTHTIQTEHVLFAAAVFTEFTKIDHMLAKSVLKTEITQNVSMTRGIKLETHKVNRNFLAIWELATLLNTLYIEEEISVEVRTYFELNNNENTIL